MMSRRPDRTEAAEYYFLYIEQVPDGDILETLKSQESEVIGFLGGIGEDASLHRYAPDKWSIREVVSHMSDTERLFVFRAFWFARGFDTPLPSFDQNIAASAAAADSRSWRSLVHEFQALRSASRAFFESLPQEAWDRRGIASEKPFSVNALAYLTAGHVAHHVKILREKYLRA
jgi:hypothetical protein